MYNRSLVTNGMAGAYEGKEPCRTNAGGGGQSSVSLSCELPCPLSSYFLNPLAFSFITYCHPPPKPIAMIYPQLLQPPARHLFLTLLTLHYNLLCHPDLPAIPNKPPPKDGAKEAKMSAVPLVQFAPAQMNASSLTAGGQSSLHPLPPPHGNIPREEVTFCVVNKSISAAGPGRSNGAFYTGFAACQNIWVNCICRHDKGCLLSDVGLARGNSSLSNNPHKNLMFS